MKNKRGKPTGDPITELAHFVPKWKQVSMLALMLASLHPTLASNHPSNLSGRTFERNNYWAFQSVFTGTVKDATGNLLQGVTVSIKGQTKALTSTDANGRFVAEVPANSVLVFKLVGFETIEVPLSSEEKDISITMNEDLAGIDEVVVVGFGTQKKESNVGSQATIKREELKVPVANLSTAIAGRLAGVVATQRSGGPGSGGANLFVRGVSTFASSPQSPLLIVDGVPDRDINNIDPEDIDHDS